MIDMIQTDQWLRLAPKLQLDKEKIADVATEFQNERNRELTMSMFGIEAYETLPGGKRRYLSVDEVRDNVRFVDGQYQYLEGDRVIPSDTIELVKSKSRTALPMLRSRWV